MASPPSLRSGSEEEPGDTSARTTDDYDDGRRRTPLEPRPPAGPPPPQGMLQVQITQAVASTVQRFWNFQGPLLTRLRGRLAQCYGLTVEVRPMAQHELDFRDVMYFGEDEEADEGNGLGLAEPEAEPPGEGGTILTEAEVAARMSREGRSRMTAAETAAVLPDSISLDDEDNEPVVGETTVTRDASDPGGEEAEVGDSVATGANRVALGTSSSWSSGRTDPGAGAKAEPKPKTSSQRASRKSMPHLFPLLCNDIQKYTANSISPRSGDVGTLVSSSMLRKGYIDLSSPQTNKAILLCTVLLIMMISRRVQVTKNAHSDLYTACFALYYLSTGSISWLARYSISSSYRTEACSLQRISPSPPKDHGEHMADNPEPRHFRTSTSGTSNHKAGLRELLARPFYLNAATEHSLPSGLSRNSRSGPNSGHVCCRTVSCFRLLVIVALMNIQVVRAANIDARVGAASTSVPEVSRQSQDTKHAYPSSASHQEW